MNFMNLLFSYQGRINRGKFWLAVLAYVIISIVLALLLGASVWVGLTLIGVPCQEWDIDPDTLGTGLPPHAPGLGAQLVTHRIPAMERATLARGYRAFDGYSRDRHAILGGVDGVDGLYLATAFSGSGFKIAPAVGMCMAELITEGRAKTVDIEAFSLRRFAEGKTVEGPYPYATRPDHRDPAASEA
jgi:glycine/D-amino acid oxidase-like deaminating enzyme